MVTVSDELPFADLRLWVRPPGDDRGDTDTSTASAGDVMSPSDTQSVRLQREPSLAGEDCYYRAG